MFCTKCGKEITDGQRFCPGCGAENKNVSQQTYGSMNTSNTFDVSTVQNVLPMKWYKFLIYFALIAGAIYEVFNGALWGQQQFFAISFNEFLEQVIRLIVIIISYHNYQSKYYYYFVGFST